MPHNQSSMTKMGGRRKGKKRKGGKVEKWGNRKGEKGKRRNVHLTTVPVVLLLSPKLVKNWLSMTPLLSFWSSRSHLFRKRMIMTCTTHTIDMRVSSGHLLLSNSRLSGRKVGGGKAKGEERRARKGGRGEAGEERTKETREEYAHHSKAYSPQSPSKARTSPAADSPSGLLPAVRRSTRWGRGR